MYTHINLVPGLPAYRQKSSFLLLSANFLFIQKRQKDEARQKEDKKKEQKEKKPGFDGRWYTDINERSENKFYSQSFKI